MSVRDGRLKTRQALVYNAAAVNQSAVSLVTEEPLVFGISVADREVFRQLSVLDEMLLVCWIPWVNRKTCIARPVAVCVDPATVEATRTCHIGRPRANGRNGRQHDRRASD